MEQANETSLFNGLDAIIQQVISKPIDKINWVPYIKRFKRLPELFEHLERALVKAEEYTEELKNGDEFDFQTQMDIKREYARGQVEIQMILNEVRA